VFFGNAKNILPNFVYEFILTYGKSTEWIEVSLQVCDILFDLHFNLRLYRWSSEWISV